MDLAVAIPFCQVGLAWSFSAGSGSACLGGACEGLQVPSAYLAVAMLCHKTRLQGGLYSMRCRANTM